MNQQYYGESFTGSPPENYQRYFVPAIGAPVADDLISVAGLRPGERVLDVACGTGVVTRLAAQQVGADGSVTGLDVNPGMLAVARAATPRDAAIEWCEASAESMPLEDETFDVALCQMGLQFVPNKLAALREMRRVLLPGGRLYVTTPGPKPRLFDIMGDALGRHVGPEAAHFCDMVFSVNDLQELRELLRAAGLHEIKVTASHKHLRLPPPAEFLWQYVGSTPMAGSAHAAGADTCEALEREVCERWQDFVDDEGMAFEVRMATAMAVK